MPGGHAAAGLRRRPSGLESLTPLLPGFLASSTARLLRFPTRKVRSCRGRRLSVAIVAAISGLAPVFVHAAQPQGRSAPTGCRSRRRHRSGPRAVGLPEGAPAARAGSSRSRRGAHADRRLFAREVSGKKTRPFAARRQADSLAAGLSRSARPSAQPAGGRRVRGRSRARRVRAADRSPARLARASASAGAATGSTLSAMPTPSASTPTPTISS